MTGPQNLARFDGYRMIHKALRSVMAETLVAVGRMDASDPCETAGAIDRCRSLLGLCRAHLEKEETFVHPAMEARAPGSASATVAEHAEHVQALARLENCLADLEGAAGDARCAAAAHLYRELGRFVGENFVHMHREETENNRILWAAYSDAELMAIDTAIAASIPPAQKAAALPWLTTALDPDERAAFFAQIRAAVPAAAFAGMLETVRPLVSDLEWRKLAIALSRPANAA